MYICKYFLHDRDCVLLLYNNKYKLVKGSFTNYVDRILAFLTTYPPALTFSMVWMLTKSGHFKTTYLPHLVNVVCERPLLVNAVDEPSHFLEYPPDFQHKNNVAYEWPLPRVLSKIRNFFYWSISPTITDSSEYILLIFIFVFCQIVACKLDQNYSDLQKMCKL